MLSITYYYIFQSDYRRIDRQIERRKLLTESHWKSNDETTEVPCKTFHVLYYYYKFCKKKKKPVGTKISKVKFCLQRKLAMFCQISRSNLFRGQNLEINQLLTLDVSVAFSRSQIHASLKLLTRTHLLIIHVLEVVTVGLWPGL